MIRRRWLAAAIDADMDELWSGSYLCDQIGMVEVESGDD